MAEEQLDADKLKEIKNLFKNWILSKNSEELNILISGKTGIGKSRLVNVVVGRKVAEEGKEKDPCTSRVARYQVIMENVVVTVWDSPGLQDGTTNEARYIQDMKNNIKEISLMIYCIRMDEARFYDADKKAIRTLTDEFEKEVWKHAVVALTFANKIENPDGEDELNYFQSQLEDWRKQFDRYFASIGIDVHIPIIPVGNMTKSMRLPDRENWLSDLWIGCFEAMKISARLGMYQMNKNRLMVGGSTATAERGDDDDDEFSTPIPLNDQQESSFLSSTWKAFLLVSAGVAVGLAASYFPVAGSVIAIKIMGSVNIIFR